MRQLTDAEINVVRECKDWGGFSAYLQTMWLMYPVLTRRIIKGNFPEKEELAKIIDKMRGHKRSFDYCYFGKLPDASINPLSVEQEAWRLLSPLIEGFTNDFENYLVGYLPQKVQARKLLAYVEKWWDLLNKWNIISRSYRCKLEKMWDELEEREEETKRLIQELTSSPCEA